jgi:hypothetical protein
MHPGPEGRVNARGKFGACTRARLRVLVASVAEPDRGRRWKKAGNVLHARVSILIQPSKPCQLA